MDLYWALDYVDETECELVCDGQLYWTAVEAEQAAIKTGQLEHYDISCYTIPDLKEIFDTENIEITDDLKIHIP